MHKHALGYFKSVVRDGSRPTPRTAFACLADDGLSITFWLAQDSGTVRGAGGSHGLSVLVLQERASLTAPRPAFFPTVFAKACEVPNNNIILYTNVHAREGERLV